MPRFELRGCKIVPVSQERITKMFEIKKLPSYIAEFFGSKGIDVSSAVITMQSDMGRDSVYKDVYIVLTENTLVYAEGSVVVADRSGGTFVEKDFIVYEKEKLEDLKVEMMISSGAVVGKYDGVDTLIFNFSNTYRHEANSFCRMYGELKKDGKINDEKAKKDLESENFCPKCHLRYPDPSRKVCPKCMDKAKLIKRLMGFFVKYKGYMLLIMLTFLLSGGLTVLSPYVSNRVFYDDVLSEGGKLFGKIGIVIAMIIGVRIVSMGVSMINGIISSRVAAKVVYDLKKTIFDAIRRLSLGFFTNRQTGGLMTQVNSDATTIYWFFCDGFPYLVTSVIQLVVVMTMMLILNPKLTLYTFLTVPLFFLSYRVVFRLFSKLHARAYSRRRSFNSLISDVLTGVRVVKSFSREEAEIKRFEKSNRNLRDATINIGTTRNLIFPAIGFMLKIGTFLVWGIGGWSVIKGEGEMTYGILMQFIAYMELVYSPLDFLADVSNWWADCLNAMQRLFEISDAVPEVREKEDPVILENIKGDVEFKNVSFSYEESRKVIDSVSFNVEAGSTLGIVGHTGAGKSTLANLLTRLYDPADGDVFIDGVNLKDISFNQLHDMIAIVSQETYLFRGSILDNIRYAKPDATYEEVVRAAKIASAHQFIIKYPDGYQTLVGWGHKDLSGGERQRVSIARAILKNPKILILDEATAAMDTQTERQIQEALNLITKDRTTIIIAHRLSTLREADKLIVVENGKVVESGTSTELLKAEGTYYKLYKLQAEALKTVGIEE